MIAASDSTCVDCRDVTRGTARWGVHQDGIEAQGPAYPCAPEEEGAPSSHQAAVPM